MKLSWLKVNCKNLNELSLETPLSISTYGIVTFTFPNHLWACLWGGAKLIGGEICGGPPHPLVSNGGATIPSTVLDRYM